MVLKLFARKREQDAASSRADAPVAVVVPTVEPPRPRPRSQAAWAQTYEPADAIELPEDSLERQLRLERFGIILNHHHHWHEHPGLKHAYQEATRAVDARFAVVPEGFASLPQTVEDTPGCPEVDTETSAFLLGRHTVANAQFQKFVDIGAYDEIDLWPREIWPHLIDFKDLTGCAGPRFWRNGRHDRRLADHPVVGICYYEAAAYALWAGYRLPTEAEWQMAASWRIRSSANVLRRYPWGDAFDVRRCNVWASGLGRTAPVTGYEDGATPNGVYQLAGNVWEWTSSDFTAMDEQGSPVVGDMLLKSIRGGAFDTYFPAQATSCFRTGLATLARTHNVGFRCAIALTGDGQ
ncbi:MAG: SUMF1/EgtB/PvdO family nonheme iron enzyme [Planctomycetes bacterium]|nr:SUMF1/EgtB/PvdO family nonheme iron enzyme [Planctomycetota bacterium]